MKILLALLTVALLVLHQDLWNWTTADPLLSGFMPIGLWYHALFCVAASALLALFVAVAWPTHLENAEPETPEAQQSEGFSGH